MSTFGGKIKEIPDISVDRFDNDNLLSLVYFLSHCHSDHMVGLNNKYFQENLINENKFIYMSDVSCEILKKMYPLMQNNIKVLDMYKPTIIMLRDKALSVTPISAGHCPGSLMFLFESDGFFLYTGDYRILKHDIKKLTSFYDSMNKVHVIDKIYLDTTFFLKSYANFPKRKESFSEMCRIIKDWTERGKDYIVHLITSAKYGSEYVFNEIYRIIRMPVHVNYDVYTTYSIIPEMDNSVTTKAHLTQIHANCGSTYQSICLHQVNKKKLRRIKVSAFRWTQDNLEDSFSRLEDDIYYICYSTHASYEEGVELIRFLKPKSIEPCVKHNDPITNLEMMQLIDEHLIEFKKVDDSVSEGPKLLDTSSTCVHRDIPKNPSSLDSDPLSSPPRENVEDLRRFLRKHSGSFNTEQKSEELETDEFNFEREFQIDTQFDKTVEKIFTECRSGEEEKYDLLEMEETGQFNTLKNSENKSLDKTESEAGSFNEWFLNLPPLEKSYSNESSRKYQNVDGLKMDNLIESGSELLKDIFFQETSPSNSNEKKDDDFCVVSLNVDKEKEDIASNNPDIYSNILPSNIFKDTDADDVYENDYPPTKKFR